MNYQEAKKKALTLDDKVNGCREYKNAYHFYQKDGEEVVGDFDIVILKSNGKAIGLTQFIIDYLPEKNPKEIDF